MRLRAGAEWEAAVYRQGLAHDGFTRLDEVSCPVVIASGDRYEAVGAGVVAAPGARPSRTAGPRSSPASATSAPWRTPPRVARSVAAAFAG